MEDTKKELEKVKGEIIKLKKEQVTASGRQSNLNPVHLQQITDLMEGHKALKNTVESIQNQSIQNHRLTGFGDETQEPSQALIDKVTEATNGRLREKLNECMAMMEAAQEKNIASHRANMKTYAQKRRQQINKESATCGQNLADLNSQTIKAYNQNSVVKMNELNAFLQKVTTQVQAFEKIVAQSSTQPVPEGKKCLYIGVANRTQGLRCWFVDGHPDEDRYRKNGWNPIWHTYSKEDMLQWVKEGNDRSNSNKSQQNDVPDEVITEKRANVGARSVDPDGERSEHLDQT